MDFNKTVTSVNVNNSIPARYAEYFNDRDVILCQARNFRLLPRMGAADLPQLLKRHEGLTLSIEAAIVMSSLDRARMCSEGMAAVLNADGDP